MRDELEALFRTEHQRLIRALSLACGDPVFAGDTLHGESEVVAARESKSRPGEGIVTFEHRGYNQRDELVCRARRNALMQRKPS